MEGIDDARAPVEDLSGTRAKETPDDIPQNEDIPEFTCMAEVSKHSYRQLVEDHLRRMCCFFAHWQRFAHPKGFMTRP